MYVIGTAGHVDHGKSALIRALTGIDPDRLQEEKERGLTIDLGFAWLTLPSGREVSIVDVPGHERFVRNMLAGAGGMDLALLVVAADEGVMPQTREHLAILDLLQVRSGVLVLTKKDLADPDWLEMVAVDVQETVKGTTLEGSPLVACSAVSGEGLNDLLAAIEERLQSTPTRRDIGRPRLPIDRAFTIAGFGTVATGTLIDGPLRVGQEVEVVPARPTGAPGALRSRIRGLQTHRKKLEEARPGSRTAVNLAGLAASRPLPRAGGDHAGLAGPHRRARREAEGPAAPYDTPFATTRPSPSTPAPARPGHGYACWTGRRCPPARRAGPSSGWLRSRPW